MTLKTFVQDCLVKHNYNQNKVVKSCYEEAVSLGLTTGNRQSFRKEVSRTFKKMRGNLKNSKVEKDAVSVKEEVGDKIYSALVSSTWIKTPEDLIEHLNVNMDVWELSKFTRNTWGSKANPNFQVKGEFRKKKVEFNEKLVIDAIKESVEKLTPLTIKSEKIRDTNKNNLLEIAIKDHHFGQKSNKAESGEEYNIEIASKLYLDTIDFMLEKSKEYKPEEIVLVVGSDFFNSDTPTNTTYMGTFQNEDDLWKTTFVKGTELIISAIEKCKQKTNKVRVIVVQGNHDYTRVFYLGIALQQRYSIDEKVVVCCGEAPRKYLHWGKNLVCFTHGDKEVRGKLPFIMSKEEPIAFATSKFIEVHCGHLHKEREMLVMCDEDVTIKQRVLPSLVASSSWSTEKGYSHTRESQGFIWNKDYGNIAVFKFHV